MKRYEQPGKENKSAWKAAALPLSYTRKFNNFHCVLKLNLARFWHAFKFVDLLGPTERLSSQPGGPESIGWRNAPIAESNSDSTVVRQALGWVSVGASPASIVDCCHQIDEMLAEFGEARGDQQAPPTGKVENCSQDQVRMLKQGDEVLAAWTVLRFKPIRTARSLARVSRATVLTPDGPLPNSALSANAMASANGGGEF
jgi:hypothetical protein